MGTETAGIRYQSEHREKVQNLMYLVNERTLMEEHQKQNRKKATEIDGVDKTSYDVKAAVPDRSRVAALSPLTAGARRVRLYPRGQRQALPRSTGAALGEVYTKEATLPPHRVW